MSAVDIDVWTLQLGDAVVLKRAFVSFGSGARIGTVVAVQRRRNRVQVEWVDGSRRWYAAKELAS